MSREHKLTRGGGGVERDQISDIRPPKKSDIRYQTPKKIKYQISRVRKNQISVFKKSDTCVADPLKNQISDIKVPPKNQISDIKVPPFHHPQLNGQTKRELAV